LCIVRRVCVWLWFRFRNRRGGVRVQRGSSESTGWPTADTKKKSNDGGGARATTDDGGIKCTSTRGHTAKPKPGAWGSEVGVGASGETHHTNPPTPNNHTAHQHQDQKQRATKDQRAPLPPPPPLAATRKEGRRTRRLVLLRACFLGSSSVCCSQPSISPASPWFVAV